jgi:thermitase
MTTHGRLWLNALFFLVPLIAGAEEFLLQGEQLSLCVDNQPLAAVLRQFAQAGVRVRLDPAVDARVTADFQNENVQSALAHILEPLGYVLIWDVVNGPLGAWPRLAEIQVFQPGRKEQMRPLPGSSENFEIVREPGGALRVKDEILVAFKSGSRREDVERQLASLGAVLLGSIPELGVYRVRLPSGSNIPAIVEQLARSPLVKTVEPHYAVAVPAPVCLEPGGAGPAGPARPVRGVEGAAPVAILDTGLQQDSTLASLVAGRFDALNPERALDDRQGHGTQMALIASGAVLPDGAGTSEAGVPVIAIRAFDDQGVASSFGLMSSMVYAVTKGARVLNMSWGTSADSRFLAETVAWAQVRGIIVVASAGNEPTGRPIYPAAYPGVVAVSALNAENQPWNSSNFGDFVSVSAPGTARFDVGYRGPPGGYAGTSIASAYVSRSLALYLARHPQATSAQAVKALREAVAPGASAHDPRLGYGRLDAEALSRLLP